MAKRLLVVDDDMAINELIKVNLEMQGYQVCQAYNGNEAFALAKQEHKDRISDLKGNFNQIAWGSQIRSYVLQPYTLVKDARTEFETANVQAVLDGELDGFINASLNALSKGEL